MNKIIVLVAIVASINTVLSSESEYEKFIADLMKPFRGLNYRRMDRSRDDDSEIVEAVKNVATNNEPDSPPENNSEIVDSVNDGLINNDEPGSPSDEKKISGRQVPVYTLGNFPADEYPNADLVVYAPNVNFPGFDLYEIDAVTDAFQCGSQFCASDIKCTHFAFRKSDNHCWLKSNYESGSDWAVPDSGLISGLIPFRACDIAKATVPSLLSCLSLGGL